MLKFYSGMTTFVRKFLHERPEMGRRARSLGLWKM